MDTLLDGVEVVWTPLGEVADYEQPTKYLVKSQNYSDDFKTPVLTAGKTFILGYTDETNGIYNASKNPVIIFDDFTTANKWVDFDFKAKSSAMKMITSKNESVILLRYIYHWINTLPSGLIEGDHKRQWISNYSYKLIPIPPLNIQAEIVRILDTFTELTAELTAELAARKKQYTYYRDKLLTFEEGEVEYFIFDGDYLLVSEDGANLLARRTPIAFSISGKSWVNNHAHVLKFNTYAERKYIECYLNSIDLTPYISGAAQPKLNQRNLNAIQIPNPSLEDKERIVSILDKFETLTTSITEGLPREIELRQKQYEYYRNMLLSFPKEEV